MAVGLLLIALMVVLLAVGLREPWSALVLLLCAPLLPSSSRLNDDNSRMRWRQLRKLNPVSRWNRLTPQPQNSPDGTQSLVGASLLAKTIAQAIKI